MSISVLPSGLLASAAIGILVIGRSSSPSPTLVRAVLFALFIAVCCGLASMVLHAVLLYRNLTPSTFTTLVGAGNLLAAILVAAIGRLKLSAVFLPVDPN